MKQRYWQIVGNDGPDKIFERKVKIGCYSENQIKQLLKVLVASAGLDFEEIVGAYAKQRTKLSNDLLHVHREFRDGTLMCGTNPHFIAKVITDGS